MNYLKKKLIRRPSEIHGEGLFASIDIPKNVVLGVCRVKPAKAPGPHTLWLEKDELVDVLCWLKFINHSTKPNVAYLSDLRVVTLRKLRAGDELTHDYGDAWTRR